MQALNLEPKIIAMANALGLTAADPVESIKRFCRERVAKMLENAGPVRTIWDVERAVSDKLNLTVREVWTEEELDALASEYVAAGETVFAALRMQLDDDTYGILIRRGALTRDGEFQYVAVIDCRGAKAARRFFTRWHEIAHALTAFNQYELPLRRTSITAIEKDPIEKLTDSIAGELGFFEPLFDPLLEAEIRSAGRLTFDVAERMRAQFCPDASYHATLNACAARAKTPVVLIEAGLGLKKHEVRAVRSPFLFPSQLPKPCLRVISVMPNSAARKAGIQIHRNMRVPSCSIIAKVFDPAFDKPAIPGESFENLCGWTTSDGSRLANLDVIIQARNVQDHATAIITPAGLRWN